jgi:hypothetical protein
MSISDLPVPICTLGFVKMQEKKWGGGLIPENKPPKGIETLQVVYEFSRFPGLLPLRASTTHGVTHARVNAETVPAELAARERTDSSQAGKAGLADESLPKKRRVKFPDLKPRPGQSEADAMKHQARDLLGTEPGNLQCVPANLRYAPSTVHLRVGLENVDQHTPFETDRREWRFPGSKSGFSAPRAPRIPPPLDHF